jgi:hypothetical protein
MSNAPFSMSPASGCAHRPSLGAAAGASSSEYSDATRRALRKGVGSESQKPEAAERKGFGGESQPHAEAARGSPHRNARQSVGSGGGSSSSSVGPVGSPAATRQRVATLRGSSAPGGLEAQRHACGLHARDTHRVSVKRAASAAAGGAHLARADAAPRRAHRPRGTLGAARMLPRAYGRHGKHAEGSSASRIAPPRHQTR